MQSVFLLHSLHSFFKPVDGFTFYFYVEIFTFTKVAKGSCIDICDKVAEVVDIGNLPRHDVPINLRNRNFYADVVGYFRTEGG